MPRTSGNNHTKSVLESYTDHLLFNRAKHTRAGGIAHFDPSAFVLNASLFSNSFAGIFSVNTNGNALNLIYTATITPVIGSYGIVGPGVFAFNFSGANGQSFRVLSSTNLLLPLTNWLPVATNQFGPGGTFNFTSPGVSGGQIFYRLKLP